MLENLGIRTKVLGVVVITAAIGTVAAVNLSTLGSDRAVGSVTTSMRDLGPAATALRLERDLTLDVLGASGEPGDEGAVAALTRARGVASEDLTAVGASLADVDTGALPATAARAVADASAAPLEITAVRSQVDADELPAVRVRAAYDDAIGSLERVPSAVALSQDDRDLSLDLLGWVAGREVMALTDVEVRRITDALAGGPPDAVQTESLYALAVRRDVLRAAFVDDIGGTGVSVPPTAGSLAQVRALLLNATTVAGIADAGAGDAPVRAVTAQLDPETVRAAGAEEQQILTAATEQLAGAAQARSAEIVAQAQRDLVSRVSIVAALVALVMGLALVVADGIVRRLRRVTAAADAMREQLPAAVAAAGSERGAPVPAVASVGDVAGRRHGRDEVGALASALDDVGALALDLAAGQARLRTSVSDAFVSVARRNQSLLDRQLGAIDVLERDETDAAALAKLFELDHTTARMRRNAESLLVIAGVEGGRRAREPMPLMDVVRTAASGVEHYDRVDVSLDAEPTVLPHAALPLAHLVAELLDNATSFSGPTSPVRVFARAHDGGVRLTVADSGVGMDDDQLAQARERLASTSHAALVDASRLGLTVVARLARRLGVSVELSSSAQPGPSRGTVADVQIPVGLFADGSAPAQPARARAAGVAGDDGSAGAAGAHRGAKTTGASTAASSARDDQDRSPDEASAPRPAEPTALPEPVVAARGPARHRVERRRWWARRPQHARPAAQRQVDADLNPPPAGPGAGDGPASDGRSVPAHRPGAVPGPARVDGPAAPARGSSAASPAPSTRDEQPAASPATSAPRTGAPAPAPRAPSTPADAGAPLVVDGAGYQPVRRTASTAPTTGARGAKPLPRRTPGARTPAPVPVPPTRAEAAAAAAASGTPAAPRTAAGAERAPETVRSTLDGFRAGVARARAQVSAPAQVVDLREGRSTRAAQDEALPTAEAPAEREGAAADETEQVTQVETERVEAGAR